MVQTQHDFFKLPFRAFGVELRPEADRGQIIVVDLVNERYVSFHFIDGHMFDFTSGAAASGVKFAVRGQALPEYAGETDILLGMEWKDTLYMAQSWAELADKLEEPLKEPPKARGDPILDKFFFMDADTYKANHEALFRFMRYVETGDGNFAQHYRLVEPPFQATKEEAGALT